jgi:hypothetical protein
MSVVFANHPTYIHQVNSSPWFAFYQWGARVPSARYKVGINYQPGRFGLAMNGFANSSSYLSNFPGFESTYEGGAGWLTEMIFTAIYSGATSAWDSKYPRNPMYIRRLRYWNTYFPESLLKVLTIADMEIFSVDNSVEYTWERFNYFYEPYTFTLENKHLLT